MENKILPELSYNNNPPGPVPIFENEKGLQTITATEYVKISDSNNGFLEGTVFDKHGNLYCVDCMSSIVYKVTPDKVVTEVFVAPEGFNPASIKIDKKGRLFLAGLGNFTSTGSIISCNPDGTDIKVIVPSTSGYAIDDLVFDRKGGIFFVDSKGSPTNPTGGVYYLSPDFKSITPVVKNMAWPNGIVLSADQKILYVTEMAAGRLHRFELQEDGITINNNGSNVPYYFTGTPGPDSATIDSDDNIYVAMFKQGKVLVFNKDGIPIGLILIPGREEGRNLFSTHVAFIPGTNQLVICTADVGGTNGQWIFTARGFAKCAREYHLE